VSSTRRIQGAEQALERLADLPGGNELLRLAGRREDVALVGGAVRDLLLGHWPRELDVSVESDAAALAWELAASVSPSERAYGHGVAPVLHERFGTASVVWDYGRIDVAARRAERYPTPGALPEVRPGTVEDDLARRDFTVNAIMLALGGPQRGRLIAFDRALEDLATGLLRVLHERSFIEDPTRVLRLGRYAARLHFEIEPRTRELAREAVAGGALETVSGGRIGAELWLAAGEGDGAGALRALDALGVLTALDMPTPFDEALAGAAAALLPRDGSPAILAMGVALHRPASGDEPAPALERLDFARERREAVRAVAERATALAEQLLDGGASFDGESPETVALAGAIAARSSSRAPDAVKAWFEQLRHVRLEIDGCDLLAAGVPEGPEIGARLRATLRRKREGSISGREQELQAALEQRPRADGALET
jgi:tRNA nucleotidyltransferase (CCA-adding enzyme)